jgi:hypothetical protein
MLEAGWCEGDMQEVFSLCAEDGGMVEGAALGADEAFCTGEIRGQGGGIAGEAVDGLGEHGRGDDECGTGREACAGWNAGLKDGLPTGGGRGEAVLVEGALDTGLEVVFPVPGGAWLEGMRVWEFETGGGIDGLEVMCDDLACVCGPGRGEDGLGGEAAGENREVVVIGM